MEAVIVVVVVDWNTYIIAASNSRGLLCCKIDYIVGGSYLHEIMDTSSVETFK
jgi:hypothetical protein